MAIRQHPYLSDISRNNLLNQFPGPRNQREAIARLVEDVQIQYKSADQAIASNNTLANDSHFLFNLVAGGVYTFELNYLITATANGGTLVDLDGGTATATYVTATYEIVSTAAIASSNVTALATDSGATVAARIHRATGLIIVNAPGTFIPRVAQNASHVDTTTYLKGSWCRVNRIPA